MIHFGLQAVSAGANPVSVKKGIDKTCTFLVEKLRENAKQISGPKDIKVAMTAWHIARPSSAVLFSEEGGLPCDRHNAMFWPAYSGCLHEGVCQPCSVRNYTVKEPLWNGVLPLLCLIQLHIKQLCKRELAIFLFVA